MVYRILVDSAARRSGHTFDFEYDISGVCTSRYLVGKLWMAAVEWISPVRYSESSPAFAKDIAGPSTLLLTCPEFAAENTHENWSRSHSPNLCALQSYCQYGFYGLSADTPYLRRAHLGCLVKGDRLQQSGSLRFRMKAVHPRDGAVTDLPPLGTNGTYGADYQFSLVLWEAPADALVERPLRGAYSFYKLWLSSNERKVGGPADVTLPLFFATGGAMLTGVWQVALESFSLLTQGTATGGSGLLVVCNDLAADSLGARPNVIGHLGRTYRANEAGFAGLVLSHKPAAADAVGHPVRVPLDRLSSLTIRLLDPATMAPPPGFTSEWVCCLTFYRVRE